jgi:hypothetical protein
MLLGTACSEALWGASKPGEPTIVGMVALLAAPQKYNGKIIRTWGFLNLRSDDNAIFLHKEDCQVPLLKNSFGLDLTEEQEKQFKSLNQTYVMVEGTLHSAGPDGPASNSGTLVHITLVHGWKPYVPFESKAK